MTQILLGRGDGKGGERRRGAIGSWRRQTEAGNTSMRHDGPGLLLRWHGSAVVWTWGGHDVVGRILGEEDGSARRGVTTLRSRAWFRRIA